MASIVIKRIQEAADRLYEIRQTISSKEEEQRKEMEVLKLERDAVQKSLIDAMNKESLTSIKVKAGDTFTKAVRKSVEIVNEVFALKWAIKNNAIGINKILVSQKLKDAKEIPQGFNMVEKEYISVRKSKKDVSE